eukprot:2046041-Prymnesium_polylepis.1
MSSSHGKQYLVRAVRLPPWSAGASDVDLRRDWLARYAASANLRGAALPLGRRACGRERAGRRGRGRSPAAGHRRARLCARDGRAAGRRAPRSRGGVRGRPCRAGRRRGRQGRATGDARRLPPICRRRRARLPAARRAPPHARPRLCAARLPGARQICVGRPPAPGGARRVRAALRGDRARPARDQPRRRLLPAASRRRGAAARRRGAERSRRPECARRARRTLGRGRAAHVPGRAVRVAGGA